MYRRLASILSLFALGALAFTSCPQGRAADPVPPMRIAAAADLEPVLPQVIAQFERLHPGQSVTASYQSSATLAMQIQNGAPFDLFLAADLPFPQRVIDAGLGESVKPVAYARGSLVLWARKNSRFQPLSLAALRDPSLKSVSIANPERAPYGRAAKAALDHLGLTAGLGGKIVTAENIAQAAQYVESGNAELGLISLTSAFTDRLKAEGTYVEVPGDAYPPIVQGAVVIKGRANAKLGRDFLDFLLSDAVGHLLQTKGLRPPALAALAAPSQP